VVSKIDLSEFSALLRQIADQLVDQYPTHKALAEAIGVHPTRFSHAVTGTGDYPFGLENCLRLAKIAKISPFAVLHAARKHDEAVLLRFFALASDDLETAERILIEVWREQLEPEDRAEVMRYAQVLAKMRARLRALNEADTPPDAGSQRATPAKAGRRARRR